MRSWSTVRIGILALATGAMVLTSGCGGKGNKRRDVAYVARDVETLYGAAKERLDAGQPKIAAALFDEVERATIELTVEMTRNVKVRAGLTEWLNAHLGAQHTVELVATIAAYNMVSRLLIAVGVEPE